MEKERNSRLGSESYILRLYRRDPDASKEALISGINEGLSRDVFWLGELEDEEPVTP